MSISRPVLAIAWICVGGLVALAGSQPDAALDIDSLATEFGGESTFTRPGEDAVIAFQVPTQVLDVAVQGGQIVKKGDLLIRGDDREERVLLEAQRFRAETDIPMRRAQAQHELAKVELSRLREAASAGGANEQEIKRAEVSEQIAAIDVEQAK